MTQQNPFKRGTYEHQYYGARVREIEDSKVRYDAAMLELPEQEHMRHLLTERAVAEVEPEHGHLSIRAREDVRLREVRAVIAAENRGEMREPEPEPEWVPVMVHHPDAGALRLLTDGTAWIVRLYGTDYGLGPVRKRERHKDGTVHPRAEIVAIAAARALNDPSGPMAPVGSPVFVGNGTEEPTVVVPVPEPDVVNRFRARLKGRTA